MENAEDELSTFQLAQDSIVESLPVRVVDTSARKAALVADISYLSAQKFATSRTQRRIAESG